MSETQVEQPVAKPELESPPGPGNKRGSCLSCLIAAALFVVGVGCFVYFVLDPLLRPAVDPNLKGPDINRVDNGNGPGTSNDQPELRGSITDYLVQTANQTSEHPLDHSLHVAQLGLNNIREHVRDYTATMVKQERVKGNLLDEEFMQVKVRHGNAEASINKAFYVKHVKPENVAGQESIWIENKNGGKLIAHGTGIQRLIKVHLAPKHWLAMRNNRYPITELGIETLIIRMLETGKSDRDYGECDVSIDRELVVDGHRCTLITITHPEKRDHFEFHIAKIYIDDELDLPIGYEGFLWPEEPGGQPLLIEKYFYRDIKINVGLTDLDFDPDNPDYDYP